jgi:YegS/Rv2252/BmrU family lipid kinase
MEPSPGAVEPADLIALLANPDSGKGEADEVAEAIGGLRAEVASFGLEDVDEAVAAAPERLVVAGGDGSLGGIAAAAARAGIPFAVIPTGTANDFARALGIPLETEAAVRVAVEGNETRRLDLVHMDRRPFLNVASLGLSPVAAEHASGLKDALGPLAYTAGALRAGIEADPVRCAVHCDGELLFEGDAWQVTVACTGAFGGGSSVDADPADGRLDVVAVEAESRARLVRHAYGLRAGEIEGQPGVHSLRCRSAEIELDGTEPFNVDGEIVESGTCAFQVEPAAVSVVVG